MNFLLFKGVKLHSPTKDCGMLTILLSNFFWLNCHDVLCCGLIEEAELNLVEFVLVFKKFKHYLRGRSKGTKNREMF